MFGWGKRRRAELDAELQKLIAEDATAAESEVISETKIVRYAAGEFLVVDDFEIRRDAIEDVLIRRRGRAPRIEDAFGCDVAVEAEDGVVQIETVSGTKWQVQCSRHVVDAQCVAIRDAWLRGRAVDV